jgi:chromosome segregation ATPase
VDEVENTLSTTYQKQNLILMSHGEGHDIYDMDPKEILSQYTVEWTTLRASYEDVKKQLREIQAKLTELDKKLENGEISEQEHIQMYREKWMMSTQMVQVKREVEARLYEIQREIRSANRKLQIQEAEKQRRERIEQEKSNAMIEYMGLKQGFDLITRRRKEINSVMDKIESQRRDGSIADDEYRKFHLEQIRLLAELRTLETDVKGRLAELLEIIRK